MCQGHSIVRDTFDPVRETGRLQSHANSLSVSPEPVEGRAGRIRRWFDKLTTNGFSETLQSSCAGYREGGMGKAAVLQ